MIVIDASVLAPALGDDGTEGTRARAALTGRGPLVAPDVIDPETVAALRSAWLRGTLSEERFGQAVADLGRLRLLRYPTGPCMPRAHELRANVTPYDACYVAIAERLGCPLLTADGRMARAPGPRCTIELIA